MFSEFEICLECKPVLAAKQQGKPALKQFSNNSEIKFKRGRQLNCVKAVR